MTKEFDIIILGGGPAGLSAAIYSARGNCSTAIIDTSMLGGQPTNYLELENYPAFPSIEGFELMEKFEEHADKFNVNKFPMEEIEEINLKEKIIKTKNNIFKTKAIILATGAKPKKLNIKGEDEFIGRGVSYCAVCDGAFYRDKIICVIGGGNSAIEEAMYLTKFASKVYVIHRRDELRADKIVQERAFKNEKIEFIWNTITLEINGENNVEKILIKNVKTEELNEILTDGVFPYVGYSPNSDSFKGQLEESNGGFIKTSETMETSIKGVFAVGDLRNTPLRQVITAASDGAIGAVYAIKHLEEL